jgi:choline dehydrogenase-like flavoprotein
VSARRFGANDTVDFVVFGSGAAGGVMARELSQDGFEVLVLEQGPRFTAADFKHDELDHWFNNALLNSPETSPQTFRRSAADTVERVRNFPSLWYARMVGGSSNHFTANYWRFHEVDFNERSLLGGITGTSFADWPIDYAELEPYYTKAEWEVGVSGLAGASPFDPPRSRPYPMPPLPVKSSGVLLERGARKLGMHPFPAPMAIASVPYRGRPACAHCGFCIGFGCEMSAKSSTLYTMLPEAEATGRCEVRSESYVFRVETNDRGACHRRQLFRSRAARALPESPRRGAVRQRCGERPAATDVGECAVPGRPCQFERARGPQPDVQHVCRGQRDLRARAERVQERAGHAHRAEPDRVVNVRAAARARLGCGVQVAARGHAACDDRRNARHFATARNQPRGPRSRPGGRVGPARVARHLQGPPRRTGDGALLQDRGVEVMQAAGAQQVWRGPVAEAPGSPHLLCTCRMGNDSKTSVVDRYHRTHDIPNLFVCDGSSFVTSGRGQPTMTIQALAFRAGEHIAGFARRGEV